MKQKQSRADRIFDITNYVVLSILVIIVFYPMYFVVIASISDPVFVGNGSVVFWPKGLMTLGYQKVFEYMDVWIGYRNTIGYTILGTVLNIALTMTFAYSLSRKTFFGKKAMTFYLLIPMFFAGGLIPTYLIVKSLGLYNTFWALIILNGINVFNVIIARTFIQGTIPEELYEAASVDGCNHFTFFFKMILPLSSPILAVLALYYGVDHWNDFFTALIYVSNKDLYSLQLVLRGILISSDIQANLVSGTDDVIQRQNEVEQLKYALIVVATVPIIAVYPFLQKYFVKGTMIGAVKS